MLLLDMANERIARCRKWERAAEEDLEATGDPEEREDLENTLDRWEERELEAREIRTLLEAAPVRTGWPSAVPCGPQEDGRPWRQPRIGGTGIGKDGRNEKI